MLLASLGGKAILVQRQLQSRRYELFPAKQVSSQGLPPGGSKEQSEPRAGRCQGCSTSLLFTPAQILGKTVHPPSANSLEMGIHAWQACVQLGREGGWSQTEGMIYSPYLQIPEEALTSSFSCRCLATLPGKLGSRHHQGPVFSREAKALWGTGLAVPDLSQTHLRENPKGIAGSQSQQSSQTALSNSW